MTTDTTDRRLAAVVARLKDEAFCLASMGATETALANARFDLDIARLRLGEYRLTGVFYEPIR